MTDSIVLSSPEDTVVSTPEYTAVLSQSIYKVTRNTAPALIVAEAKQGLPGAPGGTTTTTINIAEPSLIWTLAHFLNRFPTVTLVDTCGTVFCAAIDYLDSNIIQVTMSAPVSGTAYLN